MVGTYLGVSCYRGRSWVAQSRTGALYRGGFGTEAEAATWLAAQLGVKKSSLQRKQEFRRSGDASESKTLTLPRYSGVVPRFRSNGVVLCEARAHGELLQTFSNEHDAAVRVAGVLGCSVRKLLRRCVFRGKYARAVFKASYRAFKRYNPGDVQHTEHQERTCWEEFRKDCLVFCLDCFVWCFGLAC